MPSPDYVLAFVRGEEGELFMHADAEGLSVLISSLERLRRAVERGECDHDHLMTPEWAGSELSEKKGIESGAVIHHLKIYGWTEEWAKKHGFRE